MDSLDLIQVPISSLLSSSSNNTSSEQSTLPKTINKFVKKKLYKRTTTRTSPTSLSPRRSSSSKSSLPYRNRRHKRRASYHRGDVMSPMSSLGNFVIKRKSRKPTDTAPSSSSSAASPVASTTNRSTSGASSTRRQISALNLESPNTPQSEQNQIIIESDDDDDDEKSITPSPIRDSPLYGRQPRQRDTGSTATTLAPSNVSYPILPTLENFVRYRREPKDDSTIDSELIGKLREGPRGEVQNWQLGQVYTAAIEDEDGHVKIGWTRNIDKRMTGLNSQRRCRRIYSVPDTTTPGAQSRFLNSYHAEQIIHLELYSFRRKETATGWTEWFEMDMKQAQRVCHKWRKWLIQYNPYDENQELTEFWRKRLYIMETSDGYDAAKHKCLHKRWMAFLQPSWWDKTSYEIDIMWEKISKWWTWICENYPIIVTLVGIVFWASSGVVSFLLCISIVLVVWAGVSTTTKEEDNRR